jgi:hypothetical protein
VAKELKILHFCSGKFLGRKIKTGGSIKSAVTFQYDGTN